MKHASEKQKQKQDENNIKTLAQFQVQDKALDSVFISMTTTEV